MTSVMRCAALACALWCGTGLASAEDGHPPDHAGASSESGSGAGGEHGPAPNPLAFDPDLAVYTAIVFLLLLAVLGKFAWRPIVEALEKREDSIADHIRRAEEQHAEAKRLLEQHERRLAAAAEEVRGIMDEARRDAERTKAEILAEAKAAATAEQERALREVRSAKEVALKEIGETAANFAVDLAGKIVQRELTGPEHQRLVRDAVAQFPARN